jgi:hypothetical protein
VADGLPAGNKDQDPALQDVLTRVKADKDLAESGRRPYLPRWREWYGLHRNYRRFARAHSQANSEPDRDEVVRGAQRQFGAELFIPYVYSTIESIVPRVLMNNPKMKVKPKPGLEPSRAEAVQQVFEERQSDIDYVLKLIPVVRRGLKYGLGVGKTYWDRKGRNVPVLERAMVLKRIAAMLSGQPPPPETEFVVTDEGPMIEDVEIEDFFWDPAAKNIEDSRFAIHRTWRDFRYIKEMVDRQIWMPIDLEVVKKGGGAENKRSEMLKDRAAAAGIDNFDGKLGNLHEVWEYHDGEMVHTVLDGDLVVQSKPNPYRHRCLPFQIYRPTLQEGEFVGIGEIEPIVHLQYELNTLRSQRRDNATMTLQKAFMYAEGLVDPADLVIGPGRGIPVYGNPNDVLVPLNFPDLPASSYQEEAAIKSDIETAIGMSDTGAGGAGANNASAETATGIQLVQAAMNVRVEMKTKLLTHEYIKPQAAQWLELYIQYSQKNPITSTVEGPNGWEHIEVTSKDLDLVRAIFPEDDSTAPENGPQKRNDALALYNQTRGNDVIDPRWAAKQLLRSFDVPDVESAIMPEQTQMNPQVAQVVGETIHQTLLEAGLPDKEAQMLALAVVQRTMQQAGVSEPPAAAEESQNGSAPPPPQQEAPVG